MRSRRLFRFQLTKEQSESCQALGHRIAELMPESFKNHASRTSRLRRCYASLTQNLERLRDGISDSGSEEQALKINPYRIHAEVPARPVEQGGLTSTPIGGVRQIQGVI